MKTGRCYANFAEREKLRRAAAADCAARVARGTGDFAFCFDLLDQLGAPVARPITRGDASRLPP
jgi:hypothetical protein